MILCIAFVLFVVLGMLVYILNDNRRADVTTETSLEKQAHHGAELFAANCAQCHGPKGEGAIGPALNRKEWHAEEKDFDAASVTTFIRNVLQRGQHSPQPGIQMPAWAKEYGGPFHEEEIEDVITFITHGSWELPLRYTASPNFLVDIPANSEQKKKYPSTVAEILRTRNPAKYGTDSQSADQKKALDTDAKAEEAAKGPVYQEAERNKEELRKVLGNAKPGEQLKGLKQLLLLKGCLGCHGFGSAGTTLGPNLTEVGSRRTAEWMTEWIKNPAAMQDNRRGPNLMPWFAENKRTEFWPMQKTYMPTIQMTDQERATIVEYLAGLKVTPTSLPKETATQTEKK